MAQLPILTFDDPLFRSHSVKVSPDELQSPEFQQFLDDLTETCLANKGAGMAAAMVGVRKRVIVVAVDGVTIVVNPRIAKRSREIEPDWEASLSSNLKAIVPRHVWVHVNGLDRNGNEVHYEVTDPYQARVFQHEIGYLNAELFLDLVENKDSISER